MHVLKLILKNSMRHSLRTALTVLGVAIAVTAFCVIRSAIGAWYLQADNSSPNRLVTRHAVSIAFDLPLAYADRIASVPGVVRLSWMNWFGGVYIDQRNFFPKYVVDHTTYFKLYPEFVVAPDQWEAFCADRKGVIAGRQLADRFGWKVGDQVRIQGDIYPGDWDFVIRGIYTGANEDTDESAWFSRFDYLDETLRETWPRRAGRIGMVVEQIDDPSRAARISEQIDALFVNSLAETKTETEKAFILGFISMSTQIILGLKIISFLVIGIILLVMVNTLAMAARERVNEYALLKTLGFRSFHIIGLVCGESLAIAVAGGALGLALSFPIVSLLEIAVSAFLPKLPLSPLTLIMGMTSAVVVGLLASIFPIIRAIRTSIVNGLRPID